MTSKHPAGNCQKRHIHSMQCIIPPYMRMKLLNNADKDQAALITKLSCFSTDEELRARRTSYAKLQPGQKRLLALLQLKSKVRVFTAQADQELPKPSREVYSAEGRDELPGILVRDEDSKATGDIDVDRVYDAAGATWDFYYRLFGRNSIDNAGMKLIQTVHYMQAYDNAFWDGKQMVYGDGDGELFASFTSDIDVTGHELTHGVVQYECNLDYYGQSGALNESLADVFGIMIKQKTLNQDVKSADWLIGENILVGDQYAIRSLKAPGTAYVDHPELGTDPQPAHMSGYTNDPDDNGGVHLNSGIPSHAFYLAANDLGGFAWEKVGQVWYSAMCNAELVPVNATFEQFKQATLSTSTTLFGPKDKVTQAIENGWKGVGV
jgi:Zn-dependent metalloprotease